MIRPEPDDSCPEICDDKASMEFPFHGLVARLQFGHELQELGAGANSGEVGITGEHRIVRHARFYGFTQPANSLGALTLQRKNRYERVKGVVRVAELLHLVDVG